MQAHTETYMNFFGYQIAEDCFCEIPGCGRPTIDVHHIIPRSKFGKKTKDEQNDIKNLIGLCREHHNDAHAEKLTREFLTNIHLNFINKNG